MPVIHPRPEISGTMAARPPTVVSLVIVPENVEPITERAVRRSPVFITPRACSRAIRAESAVPVGDRSTLPGWMATAAPVSRPCAGAARRIRTSLHKGRMVVPYAAQRPRHSARAAARLALKRGLLDRLRSWLKWFETEAWTAANF